MTDVVNYYFPNVAKKLVNRRTLKYKEKPRKYMARNDIKIKMPDIENSIRDAIMRDAVVTSMADAIANSR